MSAPTQITITLDAATSKEFLIRGLSPAAVAQTMLQQVSVAPPAVTAWLTGRNNPTSLWDQLATQTKAQVRQSLAPEVALADAVRALMAVRQ